MGGGFAYALGWLSLCLALGALALPVASLLFPRDPDRGAALSFPIALAALAVATYWLGRIDFGAAPLAAVLLLAGVALVLRRRDVPVSRRGYAEAAAVFALGFGLVVLVRAVHPSINAGGEMYWDFGLLESLLRTARLPPEDPWFAGEPVRYYYGGHLLAAALAGLADTPGRYAYNVALAVFYATLVTAAYGLAGAVAAAGGGPRRTAGAFGAFFVGFAGNLYTPIRVALLALPDGLATALAAPLDIPPEDVTTFASLSIEDASHFAFTNTDFPLYSVLIGSLHAHVMSTPFLLLAAALLFGYYRTPAGERRRRLALLAALTPVAGLLALVNTWSLPTACGLVAVAVALSPAHPRSLLPGPPRLEGATPATRWLARIAAGLAAGVLVGALGVLWVAPYFARGLAGSPGLGLLPERSPLRYFVFGYGGFLLAFAAYLIGRLRANLGPSRRRTLAAGAVALALVAVAWLGDFAGLAVLGSLLLAGWYLRATDGAGYEAVLLVAGAGLALLVELAYVRESAELGRYNTVYKTYTQVWVLWAPAAGVALARVFRGGAPTPLRRDWRWAFTTLLVVSLSLYGAGSIGAHVTTAAASPYYHPGEPTLDGLAYLERDYPDVAAGIAWLDDRPGQPTIVSAPVSERRLYEFHAAPAASLTGASTLVGWNHEVDYRGEAAYDERVAVVDSIYAGTRAERARLLSAYGVEYIWDGPGEAQRYRTIDYSREPGISVAFRQGNVSIYAVNASGLSRAPP